eukprot:TRINITY_DN1874_c0_g1_i1.p1 TRINITY_DN1874_c0_g1~~TRINITY_DN1874_c0_g1_i1.p1  ORF type:complete len:189 (-),score=26.66 TRINITY_DN1874_c0_g1_i1:278-844(-)
MGSKVGTEKMAKEILGEAEFEYEKSKWVAVTACNREDLKKKSIDRSQFKVLFPNLDSEDLKTLFDAFDKDKDNSISWLEYICTAAEIRDGRKRSPLLVCQAENKLGRKNLEQLKREWYMATGVKTIQNSFASFEQFRKLMHQLPDADLKCLFAMYDQNHDDRISWAEYITVVVRLMHGSTTDKLRGIC